jgi:hypothetical protein
VEHGDTSPLQQHIVLRDHLRSINSCMRGEGWRVVGHKLEELPPVVLDGWDSVMITDEYLPWVLVDDFLVESLGLTKAYDTFHSYSQLQMFLLDFSDTFIIDIIMRGDRQWQRTWRVVKRRSPNMSAFTTYNMIGVDHHG